MRNKAQQSEQRKRPGIDVPWGGPPRVRRKKPKAEKPPQLALSFSPEKPLHDLFQEAHASHV
jgi:hypothetical protein